MTTTLEEVNHLALEQEQHGKEIQRYLTNMKKDAASRKTIKYFEEKALAVEALWATIQQKDKQINELDCPSHNYTTQQYFEQLARVYTDTITYIEEGIAKIKTQTKQKDEINKLGVLLGQLEEILDDTQAEINNGIPSNRQKQLHAKITEKWTFISQQYLELEIQKIHSSLKPAYKALEKRHEETLLQLNDHSTLTMNPQQASPTIIVQQPRSSNISLPQVKLPIFDGSYEEWSTFRDIFKKIIHENEALDDIEKMKYLKTHLRGEASRVIQHLQITSNNYTASWHILEKRYFNERLIINKLIDKVLDIPSVTQESAYKLKQLHDTIIECLEALNNLNIDTTSWGAIISRLICRKWDSETNKLFEQSLQEPNKLQHLEEILRFLQTRFQSLEAACQRKNKTTEQGHTSTERCGYCNDTKHNIYNCFKFQALAPTTRLQVVKEKKICVNCLRHPSHIRCHSTVGCHTCKRSHHTMVHVDFQEQRNQNRPRGNQQQQYNRNNQHNQQPRHQSRQYSAHHANRQNELVLLATAMIKVQNSQGTFEFLRVLIDPGSQCTFMTEEAASVLAIPRHPIRAEVSGLGNAETQTVKWMVNATLKPRFPSNYEINVPCIILPKLTQALPSEEVDININHWKNDVLADPTFNRPGPIDIILGAKEYGEILLEGIRKTDNGLLGQKTEFGWILSGNILRNKSKNIQVISLISCIEEDQQLTKFWEIEEVSPTRSLTEDENKCEEHYQQNTVRNQDGTYTVRIPFNDRLQTLGASRSRAVARVLQLEKRFLKDNQLEKRYSQFLEEYLNLNHMERCSQLFNGRYYIPHQPVIKESSTTTKLRVVFDASSKTSNGVSLNDAMYAGPKLQQELPDILLRWRTHKVVLAADIEKMYRQIKIHADDQTFQTILWRSNPNQPIEEYKLTTVTYGTTAAPYLAIRTIQQLAEDEKDNYPLAAKIAIQDFYVDDLLSGTDTVEEALEVQAELTRMFKSGGFTLRKWSSNHVQLLNSLDEELREITEDGTRKSLGVHWMPSEDNFRFKTQINMEQKITKRTILSEVAKLFDPLGWLAPVVIKAKLLIQELWLQNLKWDEAVPENIKIKWKSFQSELITVEEIIIPRWTFQTKNRQNQIHGFCDASEKAYGAVIYLKVIDHELKETKLTLLMAKSKIAPARSKTTIPRLELCAALLLAKLMKRTLAALSLNEIDKFAWTDSMITLAWIKGDVSKWKTFVANRVSEINKLLPEKHWNHVKTAENPADTISRGIDPAKLKHCKIWWNGPEWLTSTPISESCPKKLELPVVTEEIKRCHTTVIKENLCEVNIINRFSSLTKMVRVLSWCRRVLKKNWQRKNLLTVQELQNTLDVLIKQEQHYYFAEEIKSLEQNRPINKQSKLISLNPILDNNGILRVGGRLEKSQLPYEVKHPKILSAHSHLTKLIILDAHSQTLHGGNQLTLAYIRKQFWIINAKKVIKTLIGKCLKCIRYKAATIDQLMGNLPAPRVTPSHPFEHTGVDYAGPLQIRTTKGRGHKAYKGYIAIFVCFATKAVHLEVVSDMSSDTFLAAFRRFISRRGRCAHMYSDNGTNFVGASRILQKEIQDTIQNSNIQDALTSVGTQWHFIPPAAPHFGGLWEAAVKSMKYHLRRTIGETCLTYEEMSTLMSQIEACLNSRPLCPLSNDLSDFDALTPGHFLIGRPLVEPPDPIFASPTPNLTERWKLIQKIKKDFWKKWTCDYLHQLQQRYKWRNQQKNPQVGELVIVKDQDVNPSRWPLARISEVHVSDDNMVRVVTLKKSDGNPMKRPVHKLIPIPLEKINDINDNAKTKRPQSRHQRKHNMVWKKIIIAIMFIMTLRTSTALKFEVHYPPPGLYVEHIGHAKIDRGTFRMELQFNKSKILNDTINIATSIDQLASLCERARELASNTECVSLIHHLKEKQQQIEWMNKGMQRLFSNNRTKRGLLGKLMTSIFGVNDEVYTDIEQLDKNQKELIKASNHQTKFMLHALTTFNDTELRITQQLDRFQKKINEGIETIHNMHNWYRKLDENKLNIQLLSTYQVMSNYIDEVTDYHRKLLDIHYHRGHLFEIISPAHVEQTIASANMKLPTNIKIITYPLLQTKVKHSKEFIHVFGHFIITETNEFLLIKATPIPLKVTTEAYWILDIASELLAVDYNSQLYFQLNEVELRNCINIGQETFVCSPTTTRNIESTTNCIIDEIYQRSQNTSCTIQKRIFTSRIMWKRLNTPNAWMFITAEHRKIAVICDGVREDISLNHTGILIISQNCVIKTQQNVLTPRRDETFTVLQSMVHPIQPNFTESLLPANTELTMLQEPVLDASSSLNKLKQEEIEIQQQLREHKWSSIHHLATSSTIISGLAIITVISLLGYLYQKKKAKRSKPKQTNEDFAGIPLATLRSLNNLSIDANETGQNV